MKHDIKIVIGANFGDEGKGLMTDYFSNEAISQGHRCIVCLHNGGSQRGHTVKTPEGIRHVFHHFGSGTLVGADTYCMDKFILNPMIYREEYEKLQSYNIEPHVYIHPSCTVTTPFEMILNQIIEEHRGTARHGSCGMGIYETIQRDKTFPSFKIFKLQLASLDDLKTLLIKYRDRYIVDRLKAYGIMSIPEKWKSIIYNPNLITHFIDDLIFMMAHAMIEDYDFRNHHTIIFENGQGLLLDQNNQDYFPHLTPSNTGLKNPSEYLNKYLSKEKANVEVCYVSRTYVTRHGAGYLKNECTKNQIGRNILDITNISNPYQGSLRYGSLDYDDLDQQIDKDFCSAILNIPTNHNTKCSLAFTHTNEYVRPTKNDILYDNVYVSDGQTRDSVERIQIHEELNL